MLDRLRSFINRVPRSGSRQPAHTSQSIFELIAVQVSLNPNSPIDEEAFPKIRLNEESDILMAAGVSDAVIAATSERGKDLKVVKEIVSEIDRGKVSEWQRLETRLGGIRAIDSVDAVLGDLERTGFSPRAARLFWTMAKHGSNYEAIKWGIALGSLKDAEEKLSDLLLFARHPEFTLYSSVAILRMAALKPELNRYLVELLPPSRQWAVISLIRRIVHEPSLIHDSEVQRKILIYGMENNDGIPMEVAFTIAENIDLSGFLDLAKTDGRVYVAICELMRTLITQPNPHGGIEQLPDPDSLVARYVHTLRERASDVRMILALDVLRDYLGASKTAGNKRLDLLARVQQLWTERFDDDVLRAGLKHADTRWRTLCLIEKLKINSVLPDVREAFRREPDYASISVLAELGTLEDLEMLFSSIPQLVNLQERAGKELSPINVFGPESKGASEYGRIIEALARLATPDAIQKIKIAASDYDPMVRQSACKALLKLPIDKVDAEIASLIHERLKDPMAYVRHAATQAKARLVV